MRILIAGYYNQLNYGDDRLQQAWLSTLHDHQLTFINYEDPSLFDIVPFFDFLIIGGGQIVTGATGFWTRLLKELNDLDVPFGVAGVGASLGFKLSKRQMEAIIDRSRFFLLRDQGSLSHLPGSPKILTAADLSWLLPFDTSYSEPKWDIALNLRECSHIGNQFKLTNWTSPLRDFRVEAFPLSFNGPRSDYKTLKHLGYSPSYNEFRLEPAFYSKIVVTIRFHAMIFATQIGRPFIAIDYDPKMSSFVRDYALEDLLLPIDRHDLLEEKIDYVNKNYIGIRKRLLHAREQCIAQSCIIRDKITRELLAHDPVLRQRRLSYRIKKRLWRALRNL